MANCVTYGCEDTLGDHTLVLCDEYKPGGVVGAILLECGHSITDPSNPTQISAAIAAGEATLVENIKVGGGEPSPQEQDSPIAGGNPILTRYDHEYTYTDANVNAENVDFYNQVFSGRRFGGIVLHEKEAEQVTFIDKEINFQGGLVKPEGTNEFQRFVGKFKYQTKPNEVISSIHEIPAGIFEQ